MPITEVTCCNMISVPVVALKYTAVAMRNALDGTRPGLDVERPTPADGNTASIRPGLAAVRNARLDDVARLDTVDRLFRHEISPRETMPIQPRPCVAPAAHGGDPQDRLIPAGQTVDLTDAGRVETVRLGNAQGRPVVFRAATGGRRHRQARGPQSVPGGIARRIDRGRVPQRPLCLGPDPGQPGGFSCQERLDRLVALGLVAGLAGQRQVGHAVRSAARARVDMLDLQRHMPRVAVGAAAIPFFQKILPHLVASEGALLVLGAGDLRVVEHLHVEAHALDGDGCDRHQLAVPCRPAGDIVDARLQGWRQPPRGPAPVVEALLTVAQVRGAPTAPVTTPLVHLLADGAATMGHLGEVQDIIGRLVLADKRHAGGLRARVDPQFDILRVPFRTILEPDREGVGLVNDGPAVLQEPAGPCGPRRHEGLAVAGKHEYAAYAARGGGLPPPVAPSFDGLLSHMLTTRTCIRPVSCLTRLVY
ncbi:hypothetical protein Salmuc_02131 [Salipiger mucosus DSM 16094]|uniref:Uncharacterized protein n=1 Tax=Salipiger mucosus DSM 16094 TaxID=1123237 RepID=S9QV96_9RHOB|nr:hypothetical protein Salmuc_02131 [Salipiger mucosus DSM 16094]